LEEKKMKSKRIIALLIALPILAAALLVIATDRPGGPDLPNQIRSDGKTFSIASIDARPVASSDEFGLSLPTVGDIETLLKILKDRGALYDAGERESRRYGRSGSDDGFMNETALMMTDSADMARAPQAAPASEPAATGGAPVAEMDMGAGGGTHSQTNEQVAGVSEGDIVKTDGRYIYAMSQHSNELRIIRADGANLEVVSTINYDGVWSQEFYLIGNDRLVIVGSEHVPLRPLPGGGGAIAEVDIAEPDYYYGWNQSSFTIVVIYDISDRSAPTELRRVSMEGWNISSRVIGSTVYLATNKHIWGVPFNQADSTAIMPFSRDSDVDDTYGAISFDRIFYVPGTEDTSYLIVGALDVYADDPFEPTAYLGAGSNLYMSQNAMYISNTRWVQEEQFGDMLMRSAWFGGKQKTDIMRFAINGTEISYTGKGAVDGAPINQYSMDEHRGYFRIATTDWGVGTYVTVLSAADMRTVGRTEPMAPDETMQSMRFMGDMGYVVTFEMVDPLFTIDLSDPYNPRVLGELKIPGFSQYLHPVGDGLLLGIGRDTQELYTRDSRGVETVVGFRDVGLKASLFDVSNPFDPKEVDVLILGEGWAEVSHNPRALMSDSARGLYGFTAERWDNRGNWSGDAVILLVADGQLSIATTLSTGNHYGIYGSRLCFIGNTLYFVHNYGIAAYDYNSFARLGGIDF